MNLGPLRSEDIGDALALSTAEGWNQTAADWTRMIQLEPSGCFAAREAGRMIGTVTTTTYGRALAWIGMMVVHPDFRRRGVGAGLMRIALDHLHGLGIASVKLDATPAGRPLYELLEFTAETEMERWQGVVRPRATLKARTPQGDSRQSVLALDRVAFGADRSCLLDRLLSEASHGPLLVGSEHGTPEAYALARPGRIVTYVGPLIAATASTAGHLLDGILTRFAGEEVCLDLHRRGFLSADALVERGLSKRRGLLRMSHGRKIDAGTAPSICASAGPEFG